MQVLTLTEYVPLELPRDALTVAQAELIYARAAGKLGVEAPGPATGHRWRLTPGGWVGYLPIDDDLAISLQPRVKLGNIFRMLEYAYHLDVFGPDDAIHGCTALSDVYERLAGILARQVLSRSRRGLYRDYVPDDDRLLHVRGRIDLPRTAARPWDPQLHCHFQDHTADLEDNAILTQALSTIARSGLCSERTAPTVRQAYRTVAGPAPARSLVGADCLGRHYNRLNQDYRPMHALSRFFLDHSGPTHKTGDNEMVPFLVDMPLLFETFVARWLERHLPWRYTVTPQYALPLAGNAGLGIRVDLLLRDADGRVVCVMDTKYKLDDKPRLDDCQQVVAYAVACGCKEAVLLYPRKLDTAWEIWFGDVRVRALWFGLEGDLVEAGGGMVEELICGAVERSSLR